MYMKIKREELEKRLVFFGTGFGPTYRPWWVALIVVGVLLAILLLLCITRRRNIQRKSQGVQPIPYTNWTTYNWNENPAQNQQPYDPNVYYNNGGGVDTRKEEQLPSYQQAQYQRPAGPPPGPPGPPGQYQRPAGPPPGPPADVNNQQAPVNSTVVDDDEYYSGSASQPTQPAFPQQAYTKGSH